MHSSLLKCNKKGWGIHYKIYSVNAQMVHFMCYNYFDIYVTDLTT